MAPPTLTSQVESSQDTRSFGETPNSAAVLGIWGASLVLILKTHPVASVAFVLASLEACIRNPGTQRPGANLESRLWPRPDQRTLGRHACPRHMWRPPHNSGRNMQGSSSRPANRLRGLASKADFSGLCYLRGLLTLPAMSRGSINYAQSATTVFANVRSVNNSGRCPEPDFLGAEESLPTGHTGDWIPRHTFSPTQSIRSP